MKAFAIHEDQISAIIADLIEDELKWRFRRYFHDRAEDGGLGDLKFSDEERAAIVLRVGGFFDLGTDLQAELAQTPLPAWAAPIAVHLGAVNRRFRFTPAGRDSQTEACVHDADLLYAQGAAVSNLLYGRRRLVSFVAPHSLIGFTQTVLAPNLQQIPCLDARGVPPTKIAADLAFGDAIVATPSHWRFLLREGFKAPENAMAVTFGEPLSGELSAEMRKSGFGAQREIYGSTESGLIAWRDSAGDAFNLFDFLYAEENAIIRETPRGERREIQLMDNLKWEGPRRFRLTGRRDGAVQIGAVNVFPERIAQTIEGHGRVVKCIVRAGAHPSGFNRLIADIGVEAGSETNESLARSIDQWCRERLHTHERPRIYNFFQMN